MKNTNIMNFLVISCAVIIGLFILMTIFSIGPEAIGNWYRNQVY